MDEEKAIGLYIHIPFCNKKCDYCDFVSYSMDKKAQQLYLEALFEEIDQAKEKFADKTFDSIFIGGGTPSILYEGFISSLSRKLFSTLKILPNAEFTIEVNPASFTAEKFLEYVEAGINRVSVGVQCLDSKVLLNHGRIQSLADVKRTFGILKNSQFPNVNADVMIGLPTQTSSSVIKTVKFLIKQNVKHISTYSLQIEKHTALYDAVRSGKLKPANEEKVIETYNKVYTILTKAGFKRYEVSNFARPGFECKHNLKYWGEVEYLGLGVSAHSFIDGYRYYNTKRLDTYIDHMKYGKSAIYTKEYVSKNKHRTERIMLSLRTAEGLDLEKFKTDFKEDILHTRGEQINNMINQGWLEIKDGFLRVTEWYFYVSNALIAELI